MIILKYHQAVILIHLPAKAETKNHLKLFLAKKNVFSCPIPPPPPSWRCGPQKKKWSAAAPHDISKYLILRHCHSAFAVGTYSMAGAPLSGTETMFVTPFIPPTPSPEPPTSHILIIVHKTPRKKIETFSLFFCRKCIFSFHNHQFMVMT